MNQLRPSLSTDSPNFHAQSGGITILVSLMLLVLLTIAAVGMSRNSFREVVISGTSRQGAMVRNVADSGIEWSLLWMTADNQGHSSITTTATGLQNLGQALLKDDTKSGKPYDPSKSGVVDYTGPWDYSTASDLHITYSGKVGTTQWASIGLTRMGKLPLQDMSQGVTQGSFTPAQGAVSKQAPDLWAIRSDAQVQAGTGFLAPTFIHSKEAWISTPVR